MKNLVRAFALSLVVTGAVASTHIAQTTTGATIGANVSAMPVPTCPPGTADGCGIGQLGK